MNETNAINIAAIFATSGIACDAPFDAASTIFAASIFSGCFLFFPENRDFCISGYNIFDIAKAPGADITHAVRRFEGEILKNI